MSFDIERSDAHVRAQYGISTPLATIFENV